MPTPSPSDPTQPVDTIPASEVAEVYPFLPPGKDFGPSYSALPTLTVPADSFTPDSSQNPNGPGTLLLKAETINDGAGDFGYVVLAEGDIAGDFNACSLGKITIGGSFYLTVRVPKKPTKIKVTILTRKAIDISNLV
ncbi:MAG: hypothetical protein ACK480_03350 [Planctomycetota bacterium]